MFLCVQTWIAVIWSTMWIKLWATMQFTCQLKCLESIKMGIHVGLLHPARYVPSLWLCIECPFRDGSSPFVLVGIGNFLLKFSTISAQVLLLSWKPNTIISQKHANSIKHVTHFSLLLKSKQNYHKLVKAEEIMYITRTIIL